jgi:hypothetical protein
MGWFFKVPSRLGCWMFVAVGCCLLALALVSAGQTEMFLRRSVTAAGTVVSMRAKEDDDSNSSAPTLSFKSSDGHGYTVASNNFSSPAEFTVGQDVTVLYERDRPEEARIDSFYQVWGMAEVLGIIGGVFVALGIGFLRYLDWRNRRKMEAQNA